MTPISSGSRPFFASHNVESAGGIAYVGRGDTAGSDAPDDSGGQFVSMCYTDPETARICEIEITARHFDEIMLDDFFFNNTKYDSDIAAKGSQTWDAFRMKLMDDVSRELVLGPARAVKINCPLLPPHMHPAAQDSLRGLLDEVQGQQSETY